jgi:hypothetical protein
VDYCQPGEALLAMFSSEIGEVDTLQVAVYGPGDGGKS